MGRCKDCELSQDGHQVQIGSRWRFAEANTGKDRRIYPLGSSRAVTGPHADRNLGRSFDGYVMIASMPEGVFQGGFFATLPLVASNASVKSIIISASRRTTAICSNADRLAGEDRPLAGEHFQNGKQDANRRLPPGGNTRRCSPGQPDRRI